MGEESTWRDVAITAELVERINRLQFEVFTYMNNNIRGQKQSTQRSGAPTKSLTDRLRGKDGRIRGNLMGKRVDFSARSVITPDAVMDVDQVGIPHHVAMCLTVPERVTNDNIESLTRRIVNGPTHIFGAENVITANGITINLENCENRDKIRLQYGWVVERFLTDNDVVIFNRQPSLHKVGMMGHRVKLMPGNTFRLNLCCANPYNADFDGDEMNLHVPQSPAAIADVVTLMMVPTQIISPQANRPVMGIVQDSLLGAHLLSCNDVLLDRQTACHVIAHAMYAKRELPPPAIVRPKELWTGKQMLSLILPETLYLGSMPSSTDLTSHGKRVIVRRGMIVCGELRKNTLGTSAGGFVDVLYRQFGSVVTVRWMSDIQRLVNSWLMLRGFSVGVSDCVLSHKGEERVRERIETAMRYADELVREFATEDTAEASLLEGTVVKILSKCLMQTGGIVDEELDESNAIRKMVNAGSKGTPINLSQICGCVGQQSVEGRRVFAEKGGRTLSFFEHQDSTLAGHGFVENSYALGLNAYEYFYHAMGGREGLVDTAVKTATTGAAAPHSFSARAPLPTVLTALLPARFADVTQATSSAAR
jgi:DNA-directed RNA polymerase II subunit RPB1